MTYGKSSVRSRTFEDDDYVHINGNGNVKSDDLGTARALSENLTEVVDYCNRLAYRAHMRR